jgi:hypothetical protein
VDLKVELDEGEVRLLYLVQQLDDRVGKIFREGGNGLGQALVQVVADIVLLQHRLSQYTHTVRAAMP